MTRTAKAIARDILDVIACGLTLARGRGVDAVFGVAGGPSADAP